MLRKARSLHLGVCEPVCNGIHSNCLPYSNHFPVLTAPYRTLHQPCGALYCLFCLATPTELKADCDPLRFLEHAQDVREVPEAARERTRSVEGALGSMTWLLPDGRPWLHVTRA